MTKRDFILIANIMVKILREVDEQVGGSPCYLERDILKITCDELQAAWPNFDRQRFISYVNDRLDGSHSAARHG